MKYLLYVAIGGAACWIVSELFELASGGFSSLSLTITLFAFLLLSVGIWGLHQSQTPPKNRLSLSGTLLVSLSFALFTVVTLQLLLAQATEEHAESPLFMVGALALVGGMLLFGVSVIQAKQYPSWTGIALVLLTVATLSIQAVPLSTVFQNITNMLLSFTLIYMGVHALRVPR